MTCTTRAKRPGEVEGVDYYFVTKQKFEEMIDQHELLEHALVYGDYKGIPKGQVLISNTLGCTSWNHWSPCVVCLYLYSGRTETSSGNKFYRERVLKSVQRFCIPLNAPNIHPPTRRLVFATWWCQWGLLLSCMMEGLVRSIVIDSHKVIWLVAGVGLRSVDSRGCFCIQIDVLCIQTISRNIPTTDLSKFVHRIW